MHLVLMHLVLKSECRLVAIAKGATAYENRPGKFRSTRTPNYQIIAFRQNL